MIHTKLRAEVLLTEMPRFLDGDLAARCLGVKLAQIRGSSHFGVWGVVLAWGRGLPDD